MYAGEDGVETERSAGGDGEERHTDCGTFKKEKAMKVKDPSRGLYSGKVGGWIYYVRDGRGYVRSLPDPKKYEPSEKQRATNERFRAVQGFYKFFREKVSPDIWSVAAKAEGKMGSNLFFSRNCRCFDGRGTLVDAGAFHFSEGSLAPLTLPEVEPLGGGRFRVRWQPCEEMTTAAATDRLRVGVVRLGLVDRGEQDWQLRGAYWAEEERGARGDGEGEFLVEKWDEVAETHAYLLFERADGLAWSPSRHVALEL